MTPSGTPVALTNNRVKAAEVAIRIAKDYEQNRGATVIDVQKLHVTLWKMLWEHGYPLPVPCIGSSDAPVDCDLLSELDDGELRVIEVKGRGSRGSVSISEKQLNTFELCCEASWLYVVWNTTQPGPEELWAIQDPRRLDWAYTGGIRRGDGPQPPYGHEAKFEIGWELVESAGAQLWVASTEQSLANPLHAISHVELT